MKSAWRPRWKNRTSTYSVRSRFKLFSSEARSSPRDFARVLTLVASTYASRAALVRFTGATERYETDFVHTALERALREDVFDVVMIGHNLISPGGLRNVMPLAAEKNAGLVAMCAVRTIIVNPELLRETIRQWKDDGALAEDAVSDDNPLDWVLCDGVESRACRVESVLLHAFRRRG